MPEQIPQPQVPAEPPSLREVLLDQFGEMPPLTDDELRGFGRDGENW